MWKVFVVLLCFVCSAVWGAQPKVLAFAGSARTDSVNKKLILEAVSMAREMGADVTFIDLKDYPIPLYNGDLEQKNGMPENAKYIRGLMISSQVILIASPDYNSSLSALLKNTLDWASRNEKGSFSKEAFRGKRFAIMSASPGARGGSKGLIHLRAILEDIGGIVIPQQVTVAKAHCAFDEKGRLIDPKLRADLQNLVRIAINGK
jgi:NAD(P)H-dependent FMN reductase